MLSQVFKSNKQLKSVNLSCFEYLSGKCFLNLNPNVIEDIRLQHAKFIQEDYLIRSWPHFKNFYKLGFEHYEGNNFAGVAECICSCSKLIEIGITMTKKYTENDLIKLFTSVTNLKKLRFRYEPVSNKILRSISQNILGIRILSLHFSYAVLSSDSINLICKLRKLEELTICGCENFSDSAFELIGDLPELKMLRLEELNESTGAGLRHLLKIKKFYCFGCINLEDNGLIDLLRCATSLEILDIYNCKKITNSVIDVAIQVTKVRTNNVVLEINIGFKKVNTDEIKEMSPLLHIK